MLFDKCKFENKDKVAQCREDFKHKKSYFDDMPKDVLVELLELAVSRIDEAENGGENDERDWKDNLCDREFIVDELFEELQENIKLGIYE